MVNNNFVIIYFIPFQFPHQPEPRANEYDTIDTHEQGDINLKEKSEEQKGKCNEKEVLLEITNVEKSPFKFNKKYKEGKILFLGFIS